MTPAARLQAAIEVLDDISGGGAADAATSRYFRERRYIGSKDRAAIADRVFRMMRRRARLDWWIDRTLERSPASPPPPARHRVVADLVIDERWNAQRFEESFDGGEYRPAPLSRAERTLVTELTGKDLVDEAQPVWVRTECPAWIEPELMRLFKGDVEEIAALNFPAPMDLRVNTLLGDRTAALATLKAAGITAAASPLSPQGIRVNGRPALAAHDWFHAGMVEVQDEGSQLVALLADARPGQAVIDYCAGAGGKTLALAATMLNKGRLVACDVSAPRLERAVKRLRRAGVHNVERRSLGPDAKSWLKRQAGRFDRVLVDAPCSGTGTWRRNPDMKWRIGPTDVEELVAIQSTLLDQTSALVKPGGRLVYATCSLLEEENEQRVAAFLETHPAFRILPVTQVWAETIGGDCPVTGDFLRLSPGRHGTDGFFGAFLERRPLEETVEPVP